MSIESVMLSNHLTLCHLLLFLPSIFASIRVFSSELALHIKWPEYWSFSFSISPSNEYSGLIPFRIEWLISLLSKGLSRVFSINTVQKLNSLMLNLLYSPTLTFVHDYWKNHRFDCRDLCQQKYVSFLMSWLFSSDGQSIGASYSASVLPMNIQGWFL